MAQRALFIVAEAILVLYRTVGDPEAIIFERLGTYSYLDRTRDMKVLRIVADIEAHDIAAAERFYKNVLGLDRLMDHGWIVTYGSPATMPVQISFAAQGGSGAPTPDLSIEVDDVEAALDGMRNAGFTIEYGPADEPWGVRRFFVRDPFGKLVNILAHR